MLLFFKQSAFNANSINKTNNSVSLQHCTQYRRQYSVYVTSVPHQH